MKPRLSQSTFLNLCTWINPTQPTLKNQLLLERLFIKKSRKAYMTTPKSNVKSFSGKSWENITVRTMHRTFEEFIYLFSLLKFIDYQISRLPLEIITCALSYFLQTFLKTAVYVWTDLMFTYLSGLNKHHNNKIMIKT